VSKRKLILFSITAVVLSIAFNNCGKPFQSAGNYQDQSVDNLGSTTPGNVAIPPVTVAGKIRCSSSQQTTIPNISRKLFRLTPVQYNNTIHYLFNLENSVNYLSELSESTSTGDFFNEADSLVLSVDDFKYFESVIANVFQRINQVGFAKALEPHHNCGSTFSDDCAKEYLQNISTVILKRKLSAGEFADYYSIYNKAKSINNSINDGVSEALMAMLSSPYFHYRTELGENPSSTELSSFELINFLSYTLWQMPADQELIALAEDKSIFGKKAYHAQLERMINNNKFKNFIYSFSRDWLNLMSISTGANNRSGLISEVVEFIFDKFTKNKGYAELFDSSYSYLNSDLATVYGYKGELSNQIKRVNLPTEIQEQRAGLLTMSGTIQAMGKGGHYVGRAIYTMRNFMCLELPTPNENDVMEFEEHFKETVDPNLTGLDLLVAESNLQMSDSKCSSCHNKINPIGFNFAKYDLFGGYNPVDDKGKKIHFPGSINYIDIQGSFHDPKTLAPLFANSEAAPLCISNKMFKFIYGKSYNENQIAESRADNCSVYGVMNESKANGQSLKVILKSLLQHKFAVDRSKGN